MWKDDSPQKQFGEMILRKNLVKRWLATRTCEEMILEERGKWVEPRKGFKKVPSRPIVG